MRLLLVCGLLLVPFVLVPDASLRAARNAINALAIAANLEGRVRLSAPTNPSESKDTIVQIHVGSAGELNLPRERPKAAPYDLRNQFLFPLAFLIALIVGSEETRRGRIRVLAWAIPTLCLFLLIRMAAVTSVFTMTDPLPWITWEPFKLHAQKHAHAALAFCPWYAGPILIWGATLIRRTSTHSDVTRQYQPVQEQSM